MADKITFIVGNGLDLALGLKTSYKDFYSHVQKNKLHPKNKIYEAMKNDPETWSNFERTLGTYTQYIEDLLEKDRAQESIAFHNDLEEVTEDLADYLETQEKMNEKSTNDVKFTKNGFFEELPIGQRDMLQPHMPSGAVTFNFITLNYTSTLEKILPSRNTLIIPQNIIIRDIHHVHGDLSENVTLGVSDESQLSSALLGNEKDDLIKPRLIESMNDGRIDTMKRLIRGSSIVVLFGTSIGETDKYIWEYLMQWLGAKLDRFIIIHKHDAFYTDSTKRIPRRKKLFISEVQNTLLSNVAINDDEKVELRSRIFVIHNTKKLFTVEQK